MIPLKLGARALKGADHHITYSHKVSNGRGESSKELVINPNVAGIDSELAEPSTQPSPVNDEDFVYLCIEHGFIPLK